MALTAEQKAEARALWDGGMSYGQIGKRFRVSKSTICGVSRLNGWPQRNATPSRVTTAARARPLPASASTLPPLASLA